MSSFVRFCGEEKVQADNYDAAPEQSVNLMQIPLDQVFEQLNCTKHGLSSKVATSRLRFCGPNTHPHKMENGIIKFLGLMWNPLSWAMEVVALISITLANGGGRPPDWQVFVGIILVLLINSTISFIGEIKARNAAAPLMGALTLKTSVLRDGVWSEHDSAILVPGDVIFIKFGDTVPADVRIIDTVCLWAIHPKEPWIGKYTGDPAYSGSYCASGEAEAVVIATGTQTVHGEVDDEINRFEGVSQLKIAFKVIGRFCTRSIAYAMIVEYIVMFPIQRRKYRDGIESLLVLFIGGLPIAMPTVLSVTMANASRRLSQQGAIVRAGFDDLALVDVLCFNKMGTLTLNKPSFDRSLVEVFADGMDEEDVVVLAARASRINNQVAIDAAIVEMLADPNEARAGIKEVQFLPFSYIYKQTALTYIDSNGRWHRASKGAPEQVMELCNCTEDVKTKVLMMIDEFARNGFHVLAVAQQEVPEMTKESVGMPWEFVGLLPFVDPLRHDSLETIHRALNLGLKVKMITGDQFPIAKEMARRLGMGANIYPISVLLEENQIPFKELIEKADGFTELYPEDKYEIIRHMQIENHMCTMTGGRVKDREALRMAYIGISVADSTYTSKNASNIVLTEPGLSVIISAILISKGIVLRMKSYAIHTVSLIVYVIVCFMLITLIWKINLSPIMVLIISILNEGTTMAFSKDRVKQSPMAYRWKMKEIFGSGVVLGSYVVLTTVIFFRTIKDTDFFSEKFGVRSLRDENNEVRAALYLQMSIMSQAIIYITRSHSWCFSESPGILFFSAFMVAQLVATVIAVYGDCNYAKIKGVGWGWTGVIWLYSFVCFLPLDLIKFALRYIFDGKAWSVLLEIKAAFNGMVFKSPNQQPHP